MSVYRRPDPIPRRRQEHAPSPLQPVRPEPDDLNHLVARKIFAAIASGHFAEGSILPNEFALGETLGVSRTALREAIKGLSSKGMLETRRRRGTQVTDRSQWTLVDGEVISWSRKDGDTRISEELWQGLALVMPEIAALVAGDHRRLPGRGVAMAADRDLEVMDFLVKLAGSCRNRFLSSLATISLTSLARDDRNFFRVRFTDVSEASLDELRAHCVAGRTDDARRAMTAIFATKLPSETAPREFATS